MTGILIPYTDSLSFKAAYPRVLHVIYCNLPTDFNFVGVIIHFSNHAVFTDISLFRKFLLIFISKIY